MKKFFFVCSAILLGAVGSFSQTAANFNCNDCSGANHDLFADLDAGKVAVIIWVMPCSACINGALWAQTEVQNALVSYPGKVVYYLVDDNGNTNCSTLSNWASTNGITDATIISNSAISMTPYGAAGMPKIVVAAGTDHKVFYNKNAPNITAAGIANAITAAFASPTQLAELQKKQFFMGIYPNPSTSSSKISMNLVTDSKVRIELKNELGQVIQNIYKGDLRSGTHDITFSTTELAEGNYFLHFSDGINHVQERLIVSH